MSDSIIRPTGSNIQDALSRSFWRTLMCGIVLGAMGQTARAQVPEANYDESKVALYTLPDPLVTQSGQRVTSAEAWEQTRRPEILELFQSQVYGRTPEKRLELRFEVVKVFNDAVGGKATRKHVTIHFDDRADGPKMDLMVYLPNGKKGPVPAFVGLNFQGNYTVEADPRIPLTRGWVRNGEGIENNQANEKARGAASSRWPLEAILDRGFALATAYYGDIDPDYDDGFKNGVHPLFDPAGGSDRSPDAWGSIGTWAWGLSRALDYLETEEAIDAKHVAVMGHSRLGKTSLWAGAQDRRFALVVSNDSGEGGAALSRRNFGETVQRINTSFPHWFCANYKQYNERVNDLPVDQHMLVALIAPRPVLICSAEEDRWADPRGEFLSGQGADPVYRLLGTDGLAARDMPGTNVLIWSTVGYHIRPGEHDVKLADWTAYMDFADRHGFHDATPAGGSASTNAERD